MRIQGYDKTVRIVRYQIGCKVVTIPKDVWKALGIDFGDELRFSLTSKPGAMTAVVMKGLEVSAGRRRRCDHPTRKVRRQKDRVWCKVVTIPKEICAVLGIDFGDELLFSLTKKPGVMKIALVKSQGDSAGKPAAG